MNAKKRFPLKVSDHAFGRYAERVLGLDREEVVAELRRLIGPAVELCDNCRVPFRAGGENFVAVVENRTLLTILPKGAPEIGRHRPEKPKRLPRRDCELLDAVDELCPQPK